MQLRQASPVRFAHMPQVAQCGVYCWSSSRIPRVMRWAGRVEVPLAGRGRWPGSRMNCMTLLRGAAFPDVWAPVSQYGSYGPRFDAAAVSAAGDVIGLVSVHMVSSTGTESLLLHTADGLIRELSRNYYHADAYRNPLAILMLPDDPDPGGLLGCLQRLEIEDALTGAPLTPPQIVDWSGLMPTSLDGITEVNCGTLAKRPAGAAPSPERIQPRQSKPYPPEPWSIIQNPM
jgi:hypothetical protein